jgi:hypothetical protein
MEILTASVFPLFRVNKAKHEKGGKYELSNSGGWQKD